jgi:hypothetical protein
LIKTKFKVTHPTKFGELKNGIEIEKKRKENRLVLRKTTQFSTKLDPRPSGFPETCLVFHSPSPTLL